jgi:hypothetical protein
LLARVHLVPHGAAAAEVQALAAGLGPRDTEARFSLALVHDKLAEVTGRDTSIPEAERRGRVDSSAAAALALLVQCRDQGLFRNPYRLRTLRDSGYFATFRRRPEFQALLMDLSMPSNPFAAER